VMFKRGNDDTVSTVMSERLANATPLKGEKMQTFQV